MKPLYILKIGGSCLTYKREGIPEIRREFLSGLAKEIFFSMEKNLISLIIVHGGGSITHPLLNKYKIAKEIKSGVIISPKEKLAAAKIHLRMNKLNKQISEKLLNENIQAWPIQTSALFVSNNRKIKALSLESVRLAIEKNYVPVLHGDFIFDKKTGNSICPGDLVACLLARELKASRLIFASDVEGVYSNDPRCNKEVKFFSNLNLSKDSFNLKNEEEFDHSGGMRAKINYIKKYNKKNKVIIFNGLKNNNFVKALTNKKVGTLIRYK